ncbi:PREDICTED: protein G12-like [Nicrophorus vespilloides]|uniref:Protein G12-like n=1 Tax=Nicrophorus vespilloides TaxID=110193 RepID=A0ABM1M9A6_NICVS|nr:PREDICTED: protein G12-like [Nicrophorus vespilloides]
MKATVILVFLVGIACGSASLVHDFQDIVDVIPLKEIIAIARKYLNNDAEFQKVVVYLQGPEWAGLVKQIAAHPAYQYLKNHMIQAGVDVDAVIKLIHDLIAGAHPEGRSAFSLRGFLDEVEAIVPKGKLLEVIEDKRENSSDFRAFFSVFSSQTGNRFVNDVRNFDEMKRLVASLKEIDVDLDKAFDAVYKYLNWTH